MLIEGALDAVASALQQLAESVHAQRRGAVDRLAQIQANHKELIDEVAQLTKSLADRQEAAFVDGYARGATEKCNGHGPHLRPIDP